MYSIFWILLMPRYICKFTSPVWTNQRCSRWLSVHSGDLPEKTALHPTGYLRVFACLASFAKIRRLRLLKFWILGPSSFSWTVILLFYGIYNLSTSCQLVAYLFFLQILGFGSPSCLHACLHSNLVPNGCNATWDFPVLVRSFESHRPW